MAHYGTLRDYRFDPDDVDDIRGATLFNPTGDKIAKIQDVIFDHQTGQIQYLVADAGKDHRVLVPVDRVFRSIVDEENFETDLTPADLNHLPRFDEKMLEDDKNWRSHLEEHRQRMRSTEERLEKEYKEKWDDGVIEHRRGSSRNITPDTVEATGGSAQSDVPVPDLTPQRLAGKFSGTTQPMFGDSRVPEPTRMRPAGTVSRAEDAAHGAGALPPRFRDEEDLSRLRPARFHRFQEALVVRLADVCGSCSVCGRGERVA